MPVRIVGLGNQGEEYAGEPRVKFCQSDVAGWGAVLAWHMPKPSHCCHSFDLWCLCGAHACHLWVR